VTKAEIIDRLCERIGFSKHVASEVVQSIFAILKERLEKGEQVKIAGFGNFAVRVKHPRTGRNPQTGEAIMISGRRVLSFKASPVLKDAINRS